MTNIEEQQIGQIIAKDFRTFAIFELHGVDFYNKGKRTLKETAEEDGLDLAALVKEIEGAADKEPLENTAYGYWDLDALADHIQQTHHVYTQQQALLINPKLEILIEQYGKTYPELIEVKQLFNKVAGEIAVHQKKEELLLFPFIRKMMKAKRNNEPFVRPPMTPSASNPVDMLTHEHAEQGENYAQIIALTNHYTAPQDADNNYKEVLGLLAKYEFDLHKHLHLENNILFPKALAMEKTM